MITQRFLNHLKQQHWTGVFIELVIVVLGVFIGLQAQDWNQARQERSVERVYLARLVSDMDISIRKIEQERDRTTLWRKQGYAALMSVTNNQPAAAPKDPGAFTAALRMGYGSAQLGTIRELITSGKLNIISDAKLRALIVQTDSEITSTQSYIHLLADRNTQVAHVVFSRFTPGPGHDGVPREHYDFHALVTDRTFQSAMGEGLYINAVNTIWLNEMIVELKQLRAMLQAHIKSMNAS